ncbi:glycosyltransferase [Deinococcus seoulensis]|nr:glycosyltransferase [Deinococcus seoulensis]
MTYGGAQKFLISLSQEHIRSKAEVAVIGLYPGPLGQSLNDYGITYFEYNFKRKIDPRILFEIMRVIRQWSPDVVHTHLGTADFYGRIAAKLSKVKRVVSTIHNEEDWKSKAIYRHLDNFSLLFADYIVACSKSVYESLNTQSESNNKIKLIENGVDTSIEVRKSREDIYREINITTDSRLIVCIGRLEEQKNHQLLLKAISILKRPELKVCFIGAGSREVFLKELEIQLGISDNIIWIPQTSDPYSYISASDIMVLPSLWEGLPIVLLESMSLEKLIIASDIESHRHVINSGRNGFLFRSGDADDLARCIKAALDIDKNLLKDIEVSANQTVKSRYDIKEAARKYMEVYTNGKLSSAEC